MPVAIVPLQLSFLPEDIKIATWQDIESYARDVLDRPLATLADFRKCLADYNEIVTCLSEEFETRYLAMARNTADPAHKALYDHYIQSIRPEESRFDNGFQEKLLASPFADKYDEPGFAVWLRAMRTQVQIYREINLELQAKDAVTGNEYDQINAGIRIHWRGEEVTAYELGKQLLSNDRSVREEAWHALQASRHVHVGQFDDIFDQLVKLRHEMARNAGFENYCDYRFKALRRFDYTPSDCYTFHEAVAEHVVPLVQKIQEGRRRALKLDRLRPWDTEVDPHSRPPLRAFDNEADLIAKAVKGLNEIDPVFGGTLQAMDDAGMLDLMSRPNKNRGAQMLGMHRTRIPFILANLTGEAQEAIILHHELGHCVHVVQCDPIRLFPYRRWIPMETGEMASQTMELLAQDSWHHYLPHEEDCRRARKAYLEQLAVSLIWIARVDAFQHEIYTNPHDNPAQRHDRWWDIQKKFSAGMVDWSGLEAYGRSFWHKQIHLFRYPFYYIEYGIAYLGALQIWRNYKQDKKRALAQYKHALSLANMRTIPEVYEAAGARFDFSPAMMQELMGFVEEELAALD